MSLVSLIRSAPTMGEQELCESLMAQRLFGDVTEERLLITVGLAINWATLSNRDRTALLSAFIRSGHLTQSFRTHVWEQLGSELFHHVWTAASRLATLLPEARGTWLWDHHLNAADEHERQHNVHRAKAAWMAPLLAKKSNRYAIDYLIANWHCDACGALSMSQLLPDRHAFILEQVQDEHTIIEEEYMEKQEALCRGGSY